MTDYEEERRSELEVLESIYPDELTVLSPSQLSLRLTPEDSSFAGSGSGSGSGVAGGGELVVHLTITYSATYPDELPEIGLDVEEGEMSEEEEERVLMGLIGVANDSLGMALLKRTQGTKVTPESFEGWKVKFEREMREKAELEERERLRALPLKEREEVKKQTSKLTGRQLFEQDAGSLKLEMDEGDDEAVSVDVSQYERREGLSDSEDEDDAREGVGKLDLGSDSD